MSSSSCGVRYWPAGFGSAHSFAFTFTSAVTGWAPYARNVSRSARGRGSRSLMPIACHSNAVLGIGQPDLDVRGLDQQHEAAGPRARVEHDVVLDERVQGVARRPGDPGGRPIDVARRCERERARTGGVDEDEVTGIGWRRVGILARDSDVNDEVAAVGRVR